MSQHSGRSEGANVSGVLRFQNLADRDDFLSRVDRDELVRSVQVYAGRARPDVVIRTATEAQRERLLGLAAGRARWIEDFRVGIFKPPE